MKDDSKTVIEDVGEMENKASRFSTVDIPEDIQLKAEAERMLCYAKTLAPQAVSVMTDAQGSWFGLDAAGVRCTDLFEVCATCEQIGQHEDECPEGFHPIEGEETFCGRTRLAGGGPICYQPKGHTMRTIIEFKDGHAEEREDAAPSFQMDDVPPSLTLVDSQI